MNLRYLRKDKFLHCLKNGLQELKGIEVAANDLKNEIKSKESRSTLLKGLIVMFHSKIEDIILELSRMVLFGFPEKLSKESYIKIREISDHTDWMKMRDVLVERELRDKSYSSFMNQIDYLREILNVRYPVNVSEALDGLQELSATRNLIVHSGGKVDLRYFKLAGVKARVTEKKEYIPLNFDYLLSNCENAKALIYWLTDVVQDKFKKYTHTKLIKDAWNSCFRSPLLLFENWWYLDENGEVVGFKGDNPRWKSASSGERCLLALFSLLYTGKAILSDDILFSVLTCENKSKAAELISASGFIFWHD